MQSPQSYPIIGLMSGTSGDGLDISYGEFAYNGSWSFDLPHCITIPFPDDMGHLLQKSHLLSGEELRLLDIKLGRWMGQEVKKFCDTFSLSPLAVASHGHTVFHRPEINNTLQIGNGWALHTASGLPVINDFRMLDVQLGGQGAPLVPIGDMHLFSQYDYCLNLGGIANISFSEEGKRVAYDICPFNLLLNHYASKAGLAYDDGGELARRGRCIPSLETELNNISFYSKSGSKSLGREDIEKDFLPLLQKYNEPVEDILATLISHYVFQIGTLINSQNEKSLVITGGGAYNHYFVEQLEEMLKGRVKVVIPDKTVIDFKEALIFGFLGVLKIRGEVNCLSSVTGAAVDNIGGVVYGEISR